MKSIIRHQCWMTGSHFKLRISHCNWPPASCVPADYKCLRYFHNVWCFCGHILHVLTWRLQFVFIFKYRIVQGLASRGCRTTLFLFLKINKSLCPRSTDKQTAVWKFHPMGKRRRRFILTLQCIWRGNSFFGTTGGSLQPQTRAPASPKRSQSKPRGLVMVDLPHRESSLITRKQTSQG